MHFEIPAAGHGGEEAGAEQVRDLQLQRALLERVEHSPRLDARLPHPWLPQLHAGRLDLHEEDRAEVLLRDTGPPVADVRGAADQGGKKSPRQPPAGEGGGAQHSGNHPKMGQCTHGGAVPIK